MSLDPRSRERLEALGRQLPRRLSPPRTADAAPEAEPGAPSPRRHRVETEQDPQQLFRELMQVSPDGSVPPHLLERLRRLETLRRSARPDPEATAADPAAPPPAASRRRSARRTAGRSSAGASRDRGERDLYDEFLQRLEEEEEGSS